MRVVHYLHCYCTLHSSQNHPYLKINHASTSPYCGIKLHTPQVGLSEADVLLQQGHDASQQQQVWCHTCPCGSLQSRASHIMSRASATAPSPPPAPGRQLVRREGARRPVHQVGPAALQGRDKYKYTNTHIQMHKYANTQIRKYK